MNKKKNRLVLLINVVTIVCSEIILFNTTGVLNVPLAVLILSFAVAIPSSVLVLVGLVLHLSRTKHNSQSSIKGVHWKIKVGQIVAILIAALLMVILMGAVRNAMIEKEYEVMMHFNHPVWFSIEVIIALLSSVTAYAIKKFWRRDYFKESK